MSSFQSNTFDFSSLYTDLQSPSISINILLNFANLFTAQSKFTSNLIYELTLWSLDRQIWPCVLSDMPPANGQYF